MNRFWQWYQRHYVLNLGIAVGLFALQLVHLYWLGADVIATRLIGDSFFDVSALWRLVLIMVDYTEIPAIVTTTLVYLNTWRHGRRARSTLFLVLLHSQWLHIVWITDEFVVGEFLGGYTGILPPWLAWAAITIDYLEVPVIVDMIRKFGEAVRRRNVSQFVQTILLDS